VHIVVKIFSTLFLLYVAVCFALFIFQRSFIYFPQPKPESGHVPTLPLKTADGDVLVTTKESTSSTAVIYFGGNAESVFYAIPALNKAFPDAALYLLNYRGYGGSAGKPSEAAIMEDARTLYDLVKVKHSNIIVIGRSLGSGIAVHLASERAVQRLILVTPFDSAEELASRQFAYFPVRWLLQDKFESWKYAELINIPTLVIQAERDEIIPAERTVALLSHFRRGVVKLKVVPGVGHNSISDSPDYVPFLQTPP